MDYFREPAQHIEIICYCGKKYSSEYRKVGQDCLDCGRVLLDSKGKESLEYLKCLKVTTDKYEKVYDDARNVIY